MSFGLHRVSNDRPLVERRIRVEQTTRSHWTNQASTNQAWTNRGGAARLKPTSLNGAGPGPLLEAGLRAAGAQPGASEREQKAERQTTSCGSAKKRHISATRTSDHIRQQPPAQVPPPRASTTTPPRWRNVKTQHQSRCGILTRSGPGPVAERAAEIEQAWAPASLSRPSKRSVNRAASGLPPCPRAPGSNGKSARSACLRRDRRCDAATVNPEFLLDAEECQHRGIQRCLPSRSITTEKSSGHWKSIFPRTRIQRAGCPHRPAHGGTGDRGACPGAEVTGRSLWPPSAPPCSMRWSCSSPIWRAGGKRANPSGTAPAAALTARKSRLLEVRPWPDGAGAVCGKCGSRAPAHGAASLQSKLAALWNQQQESGANAAPRLGNGSRTQRTPCWRGTFRTPRYSVSTGSVRSGQVANRRAGRGQFTENHRLDSMDPFIDPDLEKQIQQDGGNPGGADAAPESGRRSVSPADKLASLTEIDAGRDTPTDEIAEEISEEKIHGEAEENPEPPPRW